MARRRIGVECGIAEPRSGGSPTPEAPVGADVGRVLSSLGTSVLFSHQKPIFLLVSPPLLHAFYRDNCHCI